MVVWGGGKLMDVRAGSIVGVMFREDGVEDEELYISQLATPGHPTATQYETAQHHCTLAETTKQAQTTHGQRVAYSIV